MLLLIIAPVKQAFKSPRGVLYPLLRTDKCPDKWQSLKGTFMSLVRLRLPVPISGTSWSISRKPVTPGCENPHDWWAKEQPWHQRQAFSLPWGLISSPNRHAALRNIHFNYTWVWWRSPTLLPCLRTDQYFRSKGTKQLVEQLLLKSFTHWIGTPANTQPHCQRVCVCVWREWREGVLVVPLSTWMPRVGVKSAGDLCLLCVRPNVFILIWLCFTLLSWVIHLRAAKPNREQEHWTCPCESLNRGLISFSCLASLNPTLNSLIQPRVSMSGVLTNRQLQSVQLCWDHTDRLKTVIIEQTQIYIPTFPHTKPSSGGWLRSIRYHGDARSESAL